jgi:hypothetical protein
MGAERFRDFHSTGWFYCSKPTSILVSSPWSKKSLDSDHGVAWKRIPRIIGIDQPLPAQSSIAIPGPPSEPVECMIASQTIYRSKSSQHIGHVSRRSDSRLHAILHWVGIRPRCFMTICSTSVIKCPSGTPLEGVSKGQTVSRV